MTDPNPHVRLHGGLEMVGGTKEFTNLNLEEEVADPTNPDPGRIWFNTTSYRIRYSQSSTKIQSIAHLEDLTNLSNSVSNSLNNVAQAIPTKLSQLTNDSGYALSTAVPTKLSQLTNDTGFLTSVSYPVTSVNGKTGPVNLKTDDVAEGASNLYFTTARAQGAISSASSSRIVYNSGTIDLATTGVAQGTYVGGIFDTYGRLTTGYKTNSYSGTLTQMSGTTIYAYNNSAPSATGGTQIVSQTITPQVVDSYINIELNTEVDASIQSASVTIAIFRETTLIAVRSGAATAYNGLTTCPIHIKVKDLVTSLNPVTYNIRIGVTSGTWYLGRGKSANFGGNNPSWWTISEEIQ